MQTTANVVRLSDTGLRCGDCRLRQRCVMAVIGKLAAADSRLRAARPLDRGHHLFTQGETPDALYVIRTGSAKSFISTPDGLEQVIGFHLPGDLVGFDDLGNDCHTSTAQLLESTAVCRFPIEIFEEYGRSNAAMYAQVLRHAGREIAREHEHTWMLSHSGSEERLAAFLLWMSDAYAERGFSAREFNLPMARQDIASYLAMAPETVSRIFGSLQDSGIIEVERRSIRIRLPDALHRMASTQGKRRSAAC